MSPVRRVGSLLAVTLAVAAFAAAQVPDATAKDQMPPAGGTPGDKAFAEKASMGSQMEIEAGKIALQKSSDEKVKAFAQQLINDHSKASDDLKSAAAEEGITLPSQLDAKHQGMLDKLNGLSGAQFDAAFKAQMIEDHKKDIAMFEKEAASGQSAVDKFASATLPTLKQHLKMAEELPGSASHSHH
jgi:putative membrane protein